MHRFLWFLLPVAFVLSSGCSSDVKIIENPLIEAATDYSLDVTRVEMSDSSAVLDMTVTGPAGTSVRLGKKMKLLADGREYALTGTEGLSENYLCRIPASRTGSFSLIFEPLPAGTESVDLKFTADGSEETFFGIDLTGKKTYGYPDGLPSSLRKVKKNMPLPEPVFAFGETKLKIHLLHYHEEITSRLDLYVTSLFGSDEYILEINPESATAECSFRQYGPALVKIYSASGNGEVWVSPGEEPDIYMDMRQSGSWAKTRVAKYFSEDDLSDRQEHIRKMSVRNVYVSGTYGDLSNVVDSDSWRDLDGYGLNISGTSEKLYEMSSDEYTAYVMSCYRSLSDSISRSDMCRATKEILELSLSQETLTALIDGYMIRNMNYLNINHLTIVDVFRRKVKLPQIDTMRAENFAAIRQIRDINSPRMLLGMNLSDYRSSVTYEYPSVCRIADLHEGLIPDLNTIAGMISRAENAELTDEDLPVLRRMDNSFYYEALTDMQEQVKAALAAEAVIQETPDVPGEELFDAIIAPHRGKVVFVDFWNTWCAPCRANIEAVEPLKETELSDEDLVWIYIADISSPENEYKSMIPSIKGLHYWLDPDQRRSLSEKFGITQIPSYVLVDRSGHYSLRNNFIHDRALMIRTLMEML